MSRIVESLCGKYMINESVEFVDYDGMFGEEGKAYSRDELYTIYFQLKKDGDPSASNYNSFEEWLSATKNIGEPMRKGRFREVTVGEGYRRRRR